MSLVLILPKGLNLPQTNTKLWADTKCIYITKHFTILHVVQETGCKFQVETIKMVWPGLSRVKIKISITFLKFFFTRIYFNTIHHGSFVFCVLSSQRVTLKSRKDKETKNMQETRKQKTTKNTMTTQHPSIPGGSNYKIKGEFFTTLFGLSKQTWPILFQGAWLQNEVSWSLPPPSPPEIKNLLLQIILCYLCHYVLLEYWSHQQKNSTYIL